MQIGGMCLVRRTVSMHLRFLWENVSIKILNYSSVYFLVEPLRYDSYLLGIALSIVDSKSSLERSTC